MGEGPGEVMPVKININVHLNCLSGTFLGPQKP